VLKADAVGLKRDANVLTAAQQTSPGQRWI